MSAAQGRENATEDYFDVKPIEGVDGDKLGHQAVAAEVFSLALSGKANTLGVFGDWGTGKSSVIGLLKASLNQKKITPVVFDAWQHSAEPLRRQILVTIAKAVDPAGVEALKARLYESRQDPVAPSVTAMGRLLLILCAVFILIVLVLSAAQVHIVGGWSWSGFGTSVAGLLGPALAPAVLLAFAVTVVAKLYENLPWGTVQRPPIVDERLDEELEVLILAASKKARFKPLILIVDELDRCPPQRVAETLELTRQFLSPSGCVTIMSADKTYLRRAWYGALGIKPQDRPGDFDEYLDKVFDRQISLPPLHSAKLSSYALELASQHGGYWSSGVHTGSLIGVLIPSSVKTPRRAKALLNHFVTQYHVAHARFGQNGEAERFEARVLEFAKLCTVQTEFPSFYAQIARTHRAASLAEDVLTSGDFREEHRREAGHYPGLALFLGQLSAAQATLRDGIAGGTPEEVEMQSLVRYLSRTAGVATGSHDLLFLETPHDSFSLEPSLAEELYSYAVDDQANAILVELEHDYLATGDAVRYIASRLEDAIGLELANACKTCFLLAGSVSVPIDSESANALLRQEFKTRQEGRLTPYTAPGRIRFASAADDISLATRIVRDPEVRKENDLNLDAQVVVAALEDLTRSDLLEAGFKYFLDTVVGALRFVRDEDRARARFLAEELLRRTAIVGRLRTSVTTSAEGVEQPDAQAVEEFDLVMELLEGNGKEWELGQVAVELASEPYVAAWAARCSTTAAITPGDANTLARVMTILPRDSWESAIAVIVHGIPTPTDFDALCAVLSHAPTDGAEHRLWDAMLAAVSFDGTSTDIEVLGRSLTGDWDDEPAAAVVAAGRLTALCVRLPEATTVAMTIKALSDAASHASSSEDSAWKLVDRTLRNLEITTVLGSSGIDRIIARSMGNENIEAVAGYDLQVCAYSLLDRRPPLSAGELMQLAASHAPLEAAIVRRFLGTHPTAGDLQAVAKARRGTGASGFGGGLLKAFDSAMTGLEAEDAADVCADLLASSWPGKTEMNVYAANASAKTKVTLIAIKQYADGRQIPARHYAMQVLEALRPLDEDVATRATRAMAKRIRGGVLDDLRLACTHISLAAGASPSSVEDLRRALAGALKKRPARADVKQIETAIRAIS